MTSRLAIVVLVAGLCGLGCGAKKPTPLVDMAAWTHIDSTEDPLGAHAPATVSCAPTSFGVEQNDSGPVFEVNTNDCNYFAARQPLGAAFEAGATLTIDLWHLGLFAAQPAEAHVALLVEGQTLWEKTLPIPSDATTFAEEWDTELNAAADAPVTFHLHNHGTNSWRLRSLAIVDP